MRNRPKLISKIRKRDGRIVRFDETKIQIAIRKAFVSVNQTPDQSSKITDEIVEELATKSHNVIPTVEQIQDIVESKLISNGLEKVAKSYILYRSKHQDLRESKKLLGVVDDLKLSFNSISILERRYLRKNESGKVVETPRDLFHRVAHTVATVDDKFPKTNTSNAEQIFYSMMSNLEFLPNSPTLMNAGTSIGQLSACFVIPIEDNLSSIFDAVKATALIHQSGGGTGYSFSKLRPHGDAVKTSGGIASGPVSFMKIFDATTEQIKQGGRRRGANMGILSVYHPDIIEFITSKSTQGVLENFNISVAVDDNFMKSVVRGTKIGLVNPRNGEVVSRVSASELFEIIASKAWETGDPGMIFIDAINRANPTPDLGPIEATNPCSEQPLLPYESCNLGSINLTKFVENRRMMWKRLGWTIRNAVHFLDNVIDANRYPMKRIADITLANRKIGLGVMGFAEMLIMLEIRYDSEAAIDTARRVMKFLQENSHAASEELGMERGSFPNFKKSVWPRRGYSRMRNATTTTIAPTGTISVIAGTSSGIEPLFALSFVRNVMEGTKLFEVNPLFEKVAKEMGFYSQELMGRIAQTGSVQNIDEVPSHVKNIFRTALDIPSYWHVRMQAEFQKYVDSGVSKTVNLPNDSVINDVKESYLLAWRSACKGITVYRYGSKPQQVLTVGEFDNQTRSRYVVADSEYSGGCAGSTCSY